MHAPSVTNTFFTSWHWLCAFNTDVFGSRPIRAVPLTSAAALKPIATQEFGLAALHVAEPGHVDAVRAVPMGGAVLESRDRAVGAAAHRMVHEVAAELPARVGEPGGEARGFRVEQDARGLER